MAPLSQPSVQALIDRANLACDPASQSLPASDARYVLRVEQTLKTWGTAVAEIHGTSLSSLNVVGAVDDGAVDDGGGQLVISHKAVVAQARLGAEHADRDARPISSPYAHMSRTRLCEILEQGLVSIKGRAEGPTLLQGMPTLDNLRLDGFEICGFSDWSLARIGDRHWDLALVCRDILERLGPAALNVFVDAYGPTMVDPVRLDWYSLAIELIS